MTVWIGNIAVLKSSSQWQLKDFLKINSSWTELFTLSQTTNFGLFQTEKSLQTTISNLIKRAKSFPKG